MAVQDAAVAVDGVGVGEGSCFGGVGVVNRCDDVRDRLTVVELRERPAEGADDCQRVRSGFEVAFVKSVGPFCEEGTFAPGARFLWVISGQRDERRGIGQSEGGGGEAILELVGKGAAGGRRPG